MNWDHRGYTVLSREDKAGVKLTTTEIEVVIVIHPVALERVVRLGLRVKG